jgi:hypothetical protein
MKKLLLLTVVGAFLMAASVCWSGIPHLIHYQGMLTDDEGTPLNTPQDITFRIYNESTGGTLKWTENQYGISVTNGLFNVNLGDSTAIDLPFDEDYWLEIDVGPGEILTPRVQLTSVGYAYRAETADTAAYAQESAAADSDWTIDGSDMYSAVSGNVGIGTTSPATKLDVVGDININSAYRIGGKRVLDHSGTLSISLGVGAGATSTHSGTFVGDSAGYSNTSGHENSFVGAGSGYSNTEGNANTFLGCEAGRDNHSGNSNTFLGAYTGWKNTSGNYNTFVGKSAGQYNTEGMGNTFVGELAGEDNTTGSENIYIGLYAGNRADTSYRNVVIGPSAGEGGIGPNNVIIGYGAGKDVVGAGNVFIGYRAGYKETGSNKLYIGNDSSEVPLIYGDFSTGRVGIGTNTPSHELTIYDGDLAVTSMGTGTGTNVERLNDGQLVRNTSSRRYKENIRELDIDPSLIFELDPVRFDWKRTGQEDIGLIAEDVDQVIPDLVIYDNQDKPDAVKYNKVAIYLLEVVKELKAENEELKKRIEAIESKE